MRGCKVTITTVADGQEHTIIRDGEAELGIGEITVKYREENADIVLRLTGNRAEIERVGDYSLSLALEEGAVCEGRIGLGDSYGSVQTLAHKVAYVVRKDAVMLSLHYDLIFGEEPQTVKLRLLARFIGGTA